MRNPYPVIDQQGDISIHNQQGVQIVLDFADPVTGTPKVMTGRTVWFEVSNGTRIALTAGATTNTMVLTITQGQFAAVVDQLLKFVILDETTSPHELYWEGQLTVRGW